MGLLVFWNLHWYFETIVFFNWYFETIVFFNWYFEKALLVFWYPSLVLWMCQLVFWYPSLVLWMCQLVFWLRLLVFWFIGILNIGILNVGILNPFRQFCKRWRSLRSAEAEAHMWQNKWEGLFLHQPPSVCQTPSLSRHSYVFLGFRMFSHCQADPPQLSLICFPRLNSTRHTPTFSEQEGKR